MSSEPRNSHRTSHVQLPSSTEITAIAAQEAQRPHAPGKDGVRYADFSTIEALCGHLDLPIEFFAFDTRSPEQILKVGEKLLDTLVTRIVKGNLDSRTIDLLTSCYDYLSEVDVPEASELLFVFGGRTPFRIETAIQLYEQGLAPQLLISGRGPFYGESESITEARRYADTAIAAGIPAAAIIIEDESITLVDNIRRSLNMLDELGKKFASIIIVNSPFAQRRGWCMWRKYLPDECKIYRVNCGTGPNFAPDNWWRNEDGLRVVLGEFIKLRNGVAFDSV